VYERVIMVNGELTRHGDQPGMSKRIRDVERHCLSICIHHAYTYSKHVSLLYNGT